MPPKTEPPPLALPPALTLREASATLARLLSAVRAAPAGERVRIDAQGLQVFDSSALAVLLECRRAALARQGGLDVLGLPAALAGMAALYGVAELLELPG